MRSMLPENRAPILFEIRAARYKALVIFIHDYLDLHRADSFPHPLIFAARYQPPAFASCADSDLLRICFQCSSVKRQVILLEIFHAAFFPAFF